MQLFLRGHWSPAVWPTVPLYDETVKCSHCRTDYKLLYKFLYKIIQLSTDMPLAKYRVTNILDYENHCLLNWRITQEKIGQNKSRMLLNFDWTDDYASYADVKLENTFTFFTKSFNIIYDINLVSCISKKSSFNQIFYF